MNTHDFLSRRRLLQLAGASAAVLTVPAVRAQKLTPIKFTLDFRISGQVAPFSAPATTWWCAATSMARPTSTTRRSRCSSA